MSLAKDERAAAAEGKGCLGRAKDDEPVFILRAQDKFAPLLVKLWAVMVTDATGEATEKSNEALDLARAMEAWQKANTKKVPD